MSKKRKKRNIGMTEGAKNAMNDYGKQVFDQLDSNFRDPNDPHNITVQSLSTHFAKEGFKKGYDYGKREERAKVFNIQERIKDFREEMRPICKKYGIDFMNSYVDMEFSAGTIKFKEQFVGSFHDMIEAYVNEMVAPLPQTP